MNIVPDGEEVIPEAPKSEAQESEQALKTQGQREINVTWEETQRMIALAVTFVSLAVAAFLSVMGREDSMTAAFVFIYGVANLVIGFYFGRTNHTRQGGTGSTDGAGR